MAKSNTKIIGMCKQKRSHADQSAIEGEVWKGVPGFDERYECSDFGRVRSLDMFVPHHPWCDGRNQKGRILNQRLGDDGYYGVVLSDGKIRVSWRTSRLVLFVFMGPSKKVVNHKDGNRINNHLSNLEYTTVQENVHHAMRTGLKKNHPNLAQRKKVKAIDLETKEEVVYESVKKCCEKMNMSRSAVAYNLAKPNRVIKEKYRIVYV